MVYVDPKDTGIVTADPVLYKAWEDRKSMRMKHFVMGREIAELDAFISTYIGRVNPVYRTEFSQIGVAMAETSSVAGCFNTTSEAKE